MFIGKKLKELREKKRLKQKDVSEILNVSRTTISKYENDRRSPDHTLLVKYAEILDTTTDDLLGHNTTHALSDNIGNSVDVTGLPGDDIKKVQEIADLFKLRKEREKGTGRRK